MTDFEMMCAMYDKAGIDYTIGDESMGNFYCDKGVLDKVIELCVRDEGGVNGYAWFCCHHTFDANGNLMSVYIWQ